jgi:hypothetical protein
MCTYNTLLLPVSTSLEAVNAVASKVLRQTFTAQGNQAIEHAVAADARSFVKDGTCCDCGMGLAKSPPPPPPPEVAPDRELRRHRRDGWSEVKIRRWLDQRASVQLKRKVEYEHRGQGGADISVWTEFVRRLLDEQLSPWVGLFTHEYRGSLDTERIAVGAVRRFIGATPEQLAEIEEDIPFVFATQRS